MRRVDKSTPHQKNCATVTGGVEKQKECRRRLVFCVADQKLRLVPGVESKTTVSANTAKHPGNKARNGFRKKADSILAAWRQQLEQMRTEAAEMNAKDRLAEEIQRLTLEDS